MSTKAKIIKAVASKAKSVVTPTKKAAIHNKMVSPTQAKANLRKNAYGEYAVSNYEKGKLVRGQRGEDVRGYQSTKEDAIQTAKGENKRYNRAHRKAMGVGRAKKAKPK